LEKLQNTHEEDLKLIENLHKDHGKSSKAAEDLRAKNDDLAKTLSSKKNKRFKILRRLWLIEMKLLGKRLQRLRINWNFCSRSIGKP
jgi:hypothetical protein